MKYRKKPVVIEAVQFNGDNQVEIGHFAGFAVEIVGSDNRVQIRTLEGVMKVAVGWWVIKGVQGEFYPCKPDIFDATYEKVD